MIGTWHGGQVTLVLETRGSLEHAFGCPCLARARFDGKGRCVTRVIVEGTGEPSCPSAILKDWSRCVGVPEELMSTCGHETEDQIRKCSKHTHRLIIPTDCIVQVLECFLERLSHLGWPRLFWMVNWKRVWGPWWFEVQQDDEFMTLVPCHGGPGSI